MLADALIGRTLASDVLHRLRQDILDSQLRPGERLRFEPLRASYRVSFSTLREALAHLVEEHLVVAEGQRGFRVAPVSRAELLDISEARVLIERETVRRAVGRADAAWDQAVRAAHAEMRAAWGAVGAVAAWGSPEWRAAHAAFHSALVSGCGSPTLLHMRDLLAQRAMRYRQLAQRFRLAPDEPPDDHATLLQAAMAHDAAAVADIVEAQIRDSVRVLEQHGAGLLSDP